MLRQGRNSRTTSNRVLNCLYRLAEGSAVIAQVGAVRARARVTEAGNTGSSVRARSGLSEAETEVQARARMHRATAGQLN